MRTTSTVTVTIAMLASAIMAICGSTEVNAQDQARSDINDRLRVCAALSGVSEQLQCFNAIVDSLDPSAAATVVESTSAVPATDDVAAVNMPIASATVNAAAPVTSPTAAEDSFGLESVQAKAAPKKEEQTKQQIKTIHAMIVSAWSTVDGRFEARLDNGQVWRETARTRRTRLPKEGSTVVISRGAFGSYKMKIGNDNRLSAVRRTK